MKKLLLLFFALCFSVSHAQTTFLVEEFNYGAGTLLTTVGWTFSSGTSNPLTATSPGLTFPGYPSVVGNAVTLTTTGEDDYKNYNATTSGSVYLAFLLNVQSSQTGDYFIALSPSTSQTNYYARTHIKSSGSGYLIGISKSNEVSGGASYGTTVFSFNTTYLIVVKHTFVTGVMNDSEQIFVLPSTIPSKEPATSEVGPYVETTKNDPADIAIVTIRQGGTSYAPGLILDGIRITDNWGLAVTGTATGVEETNSTLPTKFNLSQNYPNPFNPSTVIKYQVPQNSFVNINVYDLLGNQIRTLVREEKAAGSYELKFDASNMPSGVYFYSIQAGAFTQTKKMILLR